MRHETTVSERCEEAVAVAISEDCGTDRGYLIHCASTEENWRENAQHVVDHIAANLAGTGCDLGIANGVNLPESMLHGERTEYIEQLHLMSREQILRLLKREDARWLYQGHATPDAAHEEWPDRFEGISEEDGFWAWKHRYTGMADEKQETLERYWQEIHPRQLAELAARNREQNEQK